MNYQQYPGGYPPQGGYPPPPATGYPSQPGYGQPPASGFGQPMVSMPDPYGGYQPAPGGMPPYQQQPTSIYPTTDQYGQPHQPVGYQGAPVYPAPSYPSQQPGGGYPPTQPPVSGYGQNVPSYPGGQAYPGGVTYPGTQPYPGVQPQAAGMQSYAGGVQPYAGGVLPQAGGMQPYAGGVQPYAGGVQPHPGAATAVAGLMSVSHGQGTVKPYPNFNSEEDSKVLRKAMKGIGTDEKAISEILSTRSNKQRQDIKDRFKTMYGKDLIKEIKSELRGDFEDLCVALLKTPTEFDAEELRDAMQGTGTDERALIEILCTRSNKEIHEIKAMYKKMYSRDLEKDLMNETSGHFRRLLVSMSTGNRVESSSVDINKAKQDAKELYEAGEKKLGTDESKFNSILCSQSYEQLRLVFHEYKCLSKKSLDQVIRSEMSGDVQNGMLAIYGAVENKYRFFAERLHNSMKGAGTKDRTLIRIVVSRCEVDMVQIKQEFQRLFGKSLESFIKDDASGDYGKCLMSLVVGR